MAQFKWAGQTNPPYIQSNITGTIAVPTKTGTPTICNPANPTTGWVVGENLGHDFTDQLSLIVLRADPRVTEA